MGIGFHDMRLMWNARASGASFDRMLTIGRQCLCLHPSEVASFTAARARTAGSAGLAPGDYAFGTHAEAFLRACLGAVSVEALDYSPYDGAQHIHDMNDPVPDELAGRFDVLFDGGALEHIFNFPTAIANLMRMTKVGGRVFMSSPANNFFGHGFYQFSPELMFRVFSADNGFRIRTLQVFEARYPSPELTRNPVAYEVADPAVVRRRVGLVTKRPVMMVLEAEKLEEKPLFSRAPLQSDYLDSWSAADGSATAGHRSRPAWRTRLIAMMPRPLHVLLMGWAQRRQFSFANHQFYRRVARSAGPNATAN